MMKILRCVKCNSPLSSASCPNRLCENYGMNLLGKPTNIIPMERSRAPQATPPEAREKLHLFGVSRIDLEPNGLLLSFNRSLTDRELVTIQEMVRDYTSL